MYYLATSYRLFEDFIQALSPPQRGLIAMRIVSERLSLSFIMPSYEVLAMGQKAYEQT